MIVRFIHFSRVSVLTSRLLGNLNHLVPRCIITVTMKRLVSFWQAECCNHETCQVLGVGERYYLVTSRARNCSRFVGDVYGKDERIKVRLNVRQAVVVEEE